VCRTETAVSNGPARTVEGEVCWNKISEFQQLMLAKLESATAAGDDTRTVESRLSETITDILRINEELKQSIDKVPSS